MSAGVWSFTETQPFQDDPAVVLDGVILGARGQIEKTPSQGANFLEMGDHSMVIQLDFRDDDLPETLRHYTWRAQQRAVTESAWWKVKEAAAYGKPLVLVDFDYEVEVFTAGPELEVFRLPRPTAKSLWSGFPASYPIVATLNEVAQTVIESGTPASGEVKVLGPTVTTPGLSVGDKLVIRYVPGFYVGITTMPQQNRGSNDVTRDIEFVEARAWPSV